jgi:stearoyl-CoA desaturase (delta-9 desaturase)
VFLPLASPALVIGWHGVIVPFSAIDIGIFALFTFLTLVGVEVGFHRYFSHRAFEAKPALRITLGAFGSMAGQGPVSFWCATHRLHHECGDGPDDPHSPHVCKDRVQTLFAGLWHAHIGWLFSDNVANANRYIPDLVRDPLIRRIQRSYIAFFLAGWAIPAIIGLVCHGDWAGAISGWLWGGPLRQCFVSNSTWAANSLLHRVGTRPFNTRDDSRDCAPLALVTLGQSLHNSHHAFPYAADLRVRRGYLDSSAWIIRLFELCGWASNVKTPQQSHKGVS